MTGQEAPVPQPRGGRLLAAAILHGGAWLVVMGIAALGLAAAETALPALLGRSVDALLVDGDAHVWVIRVVALLAALVVLDALDDVAAGSAAARATAWLRRRVAGHVVTVGPRAAQRIGEGDLLGRLVGNAVQVGRAGPVAVRSLTDLLPALAAPVALALIDPWLSITFLAGVPVLLVLLRSLSRDAHAGAEAYLGAQGAIATRLVDALRGARTIAAAGTREQEARRILEPLEEMRRHGLTLWRVQMKMTAQDGLLTALLEVAVLAVGGLELSAGRLTPGQLVAAAQYVALGAGMTSVLSSVTALARARAAATRIADVLAVPAIAFGDGRLPPGPGRLVLRDLCVLRDGRPVLRDVDLVVEGGAFLALVGRAGSGKSLLAGLLGRLVVPDRGEVLLDGAPLAGLARDELRRAVTYGFERPELWGETVRDTIGFGVAAPARGGVVAAARAADALGFIKRLPRGMRTPLADAPMSGGERQRLGLARAFAHAGRVLVLDDVAASLDTATEARIAEVLMRRFADRTRIVVARRASTAAQADAVVWLEEGAIRAVASHGVLWEDGDYRALFCDSPSVPATHDRGRLQEAAA